MLGLKLNHVSKRGHLCDTHDSSNINLSAPCTTESNNELQYFTWNMACDCLNFAKSRPKAYFNRWGSSESNPCHHSSWPTTLTSNESAQSTLHEINSQDNCLLKSIQTTSKIWDHMFEINYRKYNLFCSQNNWKCWNGVVFWYEPRYRWGYKCPKCKQTMQT